MLKIKDNIDLKELEKFGFELNNDCWGEPYYFYYSFTRPNCKSEMTYTIHEKNRNIVLYGDIIVDLNVGVNKLYDLIKADLVEKSDYND